MFSFSGKRVKNLIGVDIGSASVKVVELSGDSIENAKLESYAIVPFSVGFNGDAFPSEQASSALSQALKMAGIKEKNAAMAMPTPSVITKKSSLISGLSEIEMEEQVAIDAEQFAPFSKSEEIAVDYYIEGLKKDSEEELSVVITAAKKADIEDRVALCESAGMSVSVMDVNFSAIKSAASLCVDEDVISTGTIMIVDVGATSMQIGVLYKGDQVYFRKQEFSGQQTIALDMKTAYNMDPLDAEKQRIAGDLPDDYPSRIEEPFARSIAYEIGQAIQFFISATQYSNIDLIVLVGGSATVNGLSGFVKENSGITTISINPFSKLQLSKKVSGKDIEKDAPSIALALGLALRRFDK